MIGHHWMHTALYTRDWKNVVCRKVSLVTTSLFDTFSNTILFQSSFLCLSGDSSLNFTVSDSNVFNSKTHFTDPQSTPLAWKKLTDARRTHGARECPNGPCRSITSVSHPSTKIRLHHGSTRKTPSTINTMAVVTIIMATATATMPMEIVTTATTVATPTSTGMEATITAPVAQWRTSTIRTITITPARTKMVTMMTMIVNRSFLGEHICGKLTVASAWLARASF